MFGNQWADMIVDVDEIFEVIERGRWWCSHTVISTARRDYLGDVWVLVFLHFCSALYILISTLVNNRGPLHLPLLFQPPAYFHQVGIRNPFRNHVWFAVQFTLGKVTAAFISSRILQSNFGVIDAILSYIHLPQAHTYGTKRIEARKIRQRFTVAK